MEPLILGASAALSVLATAASAFAIYSARPNVVRSLGEALDSLSRTLDDVIERRIPAAEENAARTLATAELENEQAETRRRRASALVSKLPKDDPEPEGNGAPTSPDELRQHLQTYFRGR